VTLSTFDTPGISAHGRFLILPEVQTLSIFDGTQRFKVEIIKKSAVNKPSRG
jgi:hypothetical protein